jgi:DNA-binding LytR/AlgR family response regulator
MNPPRALIAEDEHLLAEGLRADLADLWPQLSVVSVVGDGLSAVRAGLQERPDICFLDIRMPGCSGLEAAQALAEDWPDGSALPLMVFVTAYDQYALQAFEAHAVDYLVKPVDRLRLDACLQRLMQRLSERHQRADSNEPESLQQAALDQLRALLSASGLAPPSAQRGSAPAFATRLEVIQAQVGQTVHFVPVSEVIYFEAADKYVRVVTADKEHLIRMSLKDLLDQLDPQQWWQIHRGTVVQARCISKAVRDESGKAFVSLRGRSEVLTASRLYAHRFKGL